MSSFINRLKYYGLGFGFGLIFVFIFFQNRGCSWLPSNRVKNSILDRVLVVSEQDQKNLDQKGITKKEIIELLNTGAVDFDLSQKDGASKVYRLSNDQIQLFFTLPYESFVSEVKCTNQKAKKIKSTTIGTGDLIHFPNDEDLIYVDSSQVLSCKLAEIGYINQRLVLKSLKKSGKIDFAKTKFKSSPKPKIYLQFADKKGQLVGTTAIWYKNKINIQELDLMNDTPCK